MTDRTCRIGDRVRIKLDAFRWSPSYNGREGTIVRLGGRMADAEGNESYLIVLDVGGVQNVVVSERDIEEVVS
jgi:hypothetical protein